MGSGDDDDWLPTSDPLSWEDDAACSAAALEALDTYELSQVVEVNALIEALWRLDNPSAWGFLRVDRTTLADGTTIEAPDFSACHDNDAMAAAQQVYAFIQNGDRDIRHVTLIQGEWRPPLRLPKLRALRRFDYRKDSADDFIERVSLYKHPEHTLYLTRKDVQARWPQALEQLDKAATPATAVKKRRPLPRARYPEAEAYLATFPPLNREQAKEAVEAHFDATITWREFSLLKRPRRGRGEHG